MTTNEKYYSMGLETYQVPMSLFADNRTRVANAFTAAGLNKDGPVATLLHGGEQQSRYDTDHEPLFRPDSWFAWMFGIHDAGIYGSLVVDGEGKTTSIAFIPRLPAEYAIWMGKIHAPSHYVEVYAVDEAYYADEIADVLAKKGVKTVHRLVGVNLDSKNESKPAEFKGQDAFALDDGHFFNIATSLRSIKTPKELDLMRYINRISSEAHIKVMQKAKPGMMEYQLESTFLNYCYAEGGSRFVSYTCICATGNNAATLHYGHSGAPNNKLLGENDIGLFDMGGEYCCYASDITCSFPMSGKFSDKQKIVYEAALDAQLSVMAAMKPGVNYKDMHRLAERRICEHLVKAGILVGDVDELCAKFIPSYFMPHGLGHMMGLDTHDVGGYAPGVERSTEPGLRSLRMGRDLERQVLARAVRCHLEDRILIHGNKTIVFNP